MSGKESQSDDAPEKDTTKGNEQADYDGRRRRAGHMLGLLQHETHDEPV